MTDNTQTEQGLREFASWPQPVRDKVQAAFAAFELAEKDKHAGNRYTSPEWKAFCQLVRDARANPATVAPEESGPSVSLWQAISPNLKCAIAGLASACVVALFCASMHQAPSQLFTLQHYTGPAARVPVPDPMIAIMQDHRIFVPTPEAKPVSKGTDKYVAPHSTTHMTAKGTTTTYSGAQYSSTTKRY